MKPIILNPADKTRHYTVCYGRGHPSVYDMPPKKFSIGSEYLDILTGNKYHRCSLSDDGWRISSGGTPSLANIDGGNAKLGNKIYLWQQKFN